MTVERYKMAAAVYLVIRRGSTILLLKRANTGYQDGNYGLVSGHIDGDELATHAAAREALEEAGITVEPQDLRLVHTVHRLTTGASKERLELFFAVAKWEGEIRNAEPDKCDELSWYAIDDLPANTIPLVRRVLQLIDSGEPYSEYAVDPV